MELKTPRAKTWLRWGAVILFAVIGMVWWLQKTRPPEQTASKNSAPTAPVTSRKPPAEKPLVGEAIVQGYADASTTVRQDLTLVSRVLENFALLVKGDDPLPLGANEEIASALRGRNRIQLRFVPDTSPIFNAQGQIVDRWGMPLYFHAISRDRMEIRSAGPDKIMWTSDDVQRESDGSFLSAEEMQAPSLLEESLLHRKNIRK